jgi:hypothetical protein
VGVAGLILVTEQQLVGRVTHLQLAQAKETMVVTVMGRECKILRLVQVAEVAQVLLGLIAWQTLGVVPVAMVKYQPLQGFLHTTPEAVAVVPCQAFLVPALPEGWVEGVTVEKTLPLCLVLARMVRPILAAVLVEGERQAAPV